MCTLGDWQPVKVEGVQGELWCCMVGERVGLGQREIPTTPLYSPYILRQREIPQYTTSPATYQHYRSFYGGGQVTPGAHCGDV